MITRRHQLSTHLRAGRPRSPKRFRPRRAIQTGRTAEITLNTANLDPEQGAVFPTLRSQSVQEQDHKFATPKRLAILTSLGLHLIAALVGTLYIVNTAHVDDDVIIVDLMHTKPPKTRRRLPPREVKRAQLSYPRQTAEPRRPKLVTTAVRLPQSDAWLILAGDKLSSVDTREISDGSTALDTDKLNKQLFSSAQHARIKSVIPDITPDRSSSSIFDKISQPNNLQDNIDANLPTPSPVQSKGVVKRPSWRRKVEPKYPNLARRAQKEGVVVLEATIDLDGIAKNIHVIEGIGFGCDKAAVEALKSSRFTPARNGDAIVTLRIQIPYRFELED